MAALVMGLGVMFVLIGWALRKVSVAPAAHTSAAATPEAPAQA